MGYLNILAILFNDMINTICLVGQTVEIERMSDASENDSMRHLGEEMVLEI